MEPRHIARTEISLDAGCIFLTVLLGLSVARCSGITRPTFPLSFHLLAYFALSFVKYIVRVEVCEFSQAFVNILQRISSLHKSQYLVIVSTWPAFG